jgi:hypothetical protein
MARISPTLVLFGISVFLCGCPQPTEPPAPPKDGTAAIKSEASSTAPEDADPLAGSIFTREQVFEIYRGEQQGGAARKAVLARHRLIDAAGNDVPLRVKAYERALKQFAEKDPDGWSSFLETLPQ